MQDDSLRAQLREFMESNRLSQKDIADAINISQSTVSRALTRPLQRHGKASAKLFTYMQQQAIETHGEGARRVAAAFESIWDGSEEHAIAIARIIRASDGLLPAEQIRETD